MGEIIQANNNTSFLLYTQGDDTVRLQVLIQGETLWLTKKQMAILFDTSTNTMSLHLKNIYKDDELQEQATTEDFSVVQYKGTRAVKRTVKRYNLDAIIAVGYRVNSKQATKFRIRATQTLKALTD